MSNSPEDALSEASPASASAQAFEPLACVSCRSRKLKCDRQKPVCARCAKAGGECVYPESRRKPAFKRRNVRELEERLSQVEGLLKAVGKQRVQETASPNVGQIGGSSSVEAGAENVGTSLPKPPQNEPIGMGGAWFPMSPTESAPKDDFYQHGELLGLGQFETLPPFEMIEDLHNIFFETYGQSLPVVHRDNYLRSFHSPPHMRPPMCLQYAIWTMGANGHPKYGCYHDALYRRARQYLEADELKGLGEYFITLGHAQAWALVAADEAKCLLYTRAAMSSARCVRLVGMMGLHRLDDGLSEELPMAPMIAPAKTWAETEERRRLFWGSFCIDSYASISTGWPSMIDVHQVTTHLPASEEAFTTGVEEKSWPLLDVFKGASYSTFGANVVVCYIFGQLLKHAHRPMPDDRPEDTEYGPFWKRHRELDNMLSSAFMFLPERFRLPSNVRDPLAVQANLNLHAAAICLHNAACEKADKFKLPHIKQTSRTRALTAAQEIVDIIKLTSHLRRGYSPLMALSLYCAASVYVAQAKENPIECNSTNLELIMRAMEAVGRQHLITNAYLNQLLQDLERNGVSGLVSFRPSTGHENKITQGIPVIVRGSISRHSKVQPPLPGRLPLGAPQGIAPDPAAGIGAASCAPRIEIYPYSEKGDGGDRASKRIRTSAPTAARPAHTNVPSSSSWSSERAGPSSMDNKPAPALFGYPGGWFYSLKYMESSTTTTTLPHRTGSPATGSRSVPANIVPNMGGIRMTATNNSEERIETAFTQQALGTSAPLGGVSASYSPNTNIATATAGDAQNLDVFELGEWGAANPESFYAMLTDVFESGDNEYDDGGLGTSQSHDNGGMSSWAPGN